MPGARRRPVGDVKEQIVVAAVAAEYGEAQVVADLGFNAPIAPFQHHPLAPRTVALVLAGHAKQVALVVNRDLLGRHEQQAVIHPGAVFDRDTAGHRAAVIARDGAHPDFARAARRLGVGQGIHGKAGGEHLGEQDQVGLGTVLRQSRGELVPIITRVLPGQFVLNQRHSQIAHHCLVASCSAQSPLKILNLDQRSRKRGRVRPVQRRGEQPCGEQGLSKAKACRAEQCGAEQYLSNNTSQTMPLK